MTHTANLVCSHKWQRLVFCLLFALFAHASSAYAQRPEAASRTTRTIAPDTTPLLFTFSLSPERFEPAHDTLPDHNFRMYEPSRREMIDYGTLGNLGSSARSLFYEPVQRKGLRLGYEAYDLYRLRPEALRFYRNVRSFSEVYFSQGRNQLDGLLNARFSRTFADRVNFSMDYRTINNRGGFRYQRDKHNSLALGIWVPKGRNYDVFLTFCNNIFRQRENGGIASDTVFQNDDFSGPAAAAIRLPDLKAESRHADQSLQLTQHYRFVGGKESGKRALRASHSFSWVREQFKFAQPQLSQDTAFFRDFLVDKRGLRNYNRLDKIDNTFTLSTFKVKGRGQPSDMLYVGVNYAWFRANLDARDSTMSNLFLTGGLSIAPTSRFELNAKGNLALHAPGEFNLNGNLLLGLSRFASLSAKALVQRYTPSLLQHELYVSRRSVWKNNFDKPFETSVSATLAIPRLGISFSGQNHLIVNYLYYDQMGRPKQLTDALNVVQFIARANLKWGVIHLDNTLALQQVNSNNLRLPGWFSKNSFYYAGRVFKKRLMLQAGADFRVNESFQADGFQPLTAQFHLQDSVRAQSYPWLDLFAAFKVQNFRFFIRYENATRLWEKSTVFYQTARYPGQFNGIRIGIGWRFMDSNEKEANQGGQNSGSGGAPSGTQGGRGGAPAGTQGRNKK